MDEKVDKMASYEKEIDEKMEVVKKMLNSARSTLKQAGVDSHSRSPTSRTTKIITRREFATQVSQVTMPAKGSPERSITTIKNHSHDLRLLSLLLLLLYLCFRLPYCRRNPLWPSTTWAHR